MQNNIRALHSQEKDYSVLTTSARARARTRESVEDLGDYAADALGWNRVPPVVLGDIGRFLDQGMDPFVIMTAIDEASIAPRPSWNGRAVDRRVLVRLVRPGAQLPAYATDGSAGADLRSAADGPVTVPARGRAVIPTGIAIALESAEYVAYLYARSGLAIKHGIAPANCVGVIDSDYRGEVCVGLINQTTEPFVIEPNERIAQMVISPVILPEIEVMDELDDTDRGAGGFGSTGR